MKESKKIRIGIGGLQNGYGHLRSYRNDPRVILRAICDSDPDWLKWVADKEKPVKCYENFTDMANDPEIDAVSVCTPTVHHTEMVVAALKAGKHVLCEKPAGINQWELQQMLALAAEKNLFFMEAYMYRCHPQMARLVDLVREGAIGKVGTIQATFSFHAGFDPESRLRITGSGGRTTTMYFDLETLRIHS